MNKFHKETLARLCEKWAKEEQERQCLKAEDESTKQHDDHGEDEQQLRDYFRELYKNSNKGIKGRGKGRKVEVLVTGS